MFTTNYCTQVLQGNGEFQDFYDEEMVDLEEEGGPTVQYGPHIPEELVQVRAYLLM